MKELNKKESGIVDMYTSKVATLSEAVLLLVMQHKWNAAEAKEFLTQQKNKKNDPARKSSETH